MKGNRKPKQRKPIDEVLVRRDYYIKPDQDNWLKKLSQERNVPVAEIIRGLIDQQINQEGNKAA